MTDSFRQAQLVVQQFMAESRTRHSFVVAEIEMIEREGAIVLRGHVLSAKQAQSISRKLSRFENVMLELDVLAETGVRDSWVAPRYAVVDVHDGPTCDARLSTQLEEFDPTPRRLEVPNAPDGFVCCKGMDGTVGWLREHDVINLSQPRMGGVRTRALCGEPVLVDVELSELMGELDACLDSPYRLGGRTPGGIDCSGLLQRAFLRSVGLLLPRHTSDQMRLGVRRTIMTARPGDVVFLQRRAGSRHLHAGVLRDSVSYGVVHASRDELRVTLEPLNLLKNRYDVLAWRSFVAFER